MGKPLPSPNPYKPYCITKHISFSDRSFYYRLDIKTVPTIPIQLDLIPEVRSQCQAALSPVLNYQKSDWESFTQPGILYTTRKQVFADKFDRVKDAYHTWSTIFKPSLRQKRKEEECAIGGEDELFRRMHEVKEALITLTRYMDDAEQKLEQLFKRKSKGKERLIPPSNLTVNLPQLSLPTFNGDSRQWRQFWSSFNAAVHSQEIQKLNYLFLCLRGNALEVVSGYEIAPENYEVKNCQNPSTFTDTKFTFNKLGQKPRYNPGGTSALSIISSNPKLSSSAIQSDQHSSQFTITKRRPCESPLKKRSVLKTITAAKDEQYVKGRHYNLAEWLLIRQAQSQNLTSEEIEK
ncbi:putative Gag protein [Dirofilaria immitis]|nr:putative Gag protein [Dirofilaria immitis]